MNRCLRPCQQAVSVEEYRGEALRLEQYLGTNGASLRDSTEAARDRMSADMQFEEAARLHQRLTRIAEVQSLSGDLARALDRLNGVAITPSSQPEAVELWFMTSGAWQPARSVNLSESVSAGSSLDQRLRELAASIPQSIKTNPEHISILQRWQGSSWRDGEWIGFEEFSKLPYRKLVNAIGRVARHAHSGARS
jgi:excinuclease UvrABC nuclease subunit